MSIAEARPLPLFPLSSVVLFPRTRVPLHIFERRYRQMLAGVLKGDRLLGMVTVLPEHLRQRAVSEDSTQVFPVGCAGFVTDFERLADGCYDIVLQGTQRFRILHEDPLEGERLYRVAQVEMLEEPEPAGACERLTVLRHEVMDLLQRLAHGSQRAGLEVSASRLGPLDHSSFTNALCLAIGLPPVEKQGLLEANGVQQRLESLEGLLRFHLAAAGGGVAPERPVVH